MRPAVARSPAAQALLHPVVLASIAVLLVNDLVLKRALPGVVTGKLSDLAGLVFLPILVAFVLGARSARAVGIAAVGVGSAFLAVKTSQPACDAYAAALGLVQWIVAVPSWLLRDAVLPRPSLATVMCDPTDLVALPFLLVGPAIAHRAAGDPGAKDETHCAPRQATHIGSS